MKVAFENERKDLCIPNAMVPKFLDAEVWHPVFQPLMGVPMACKLHRSRGMGQQYG